MFGILKKLLHRGREEDYDDLRSHVLGERFQPEFEQPPGPGRFQQPPPAYEEFSPKTANVFEPFPTVPQPPSLRPELERTAERTSRDYEILDRLDIIESQLAVVRSQTETINERLKNMEGKLGFQRRY